jgi:NAD(P)H dehydrogenase (quinone)
MAKIVVIVGHSKAGSFCQALGDAYVRGALAGGHEAEHFETATLAFDPILREGYERAQPLEPDLERARAAMLAADHLVIIFPLWLGTMPAILKGFLERVLQPDLVEGAKQKQFPKLFKGKSAHVIVTMGMPGFVYRWWYGAHALKVLKRNILSFLGAGPVRSTVHGYVEGVGVEGRQRWLDEAEAMGRDAG